MTEDEAKTKWCPFYVVTVAGHYTLDNRARNDGGDTERGAYRCIASACMAWRWRDDIERRWTKEPPEGEGWQHVAAIGGIEHWARTTASGHGYCGLAGEPR